LQSLDAVEGEVVIAGEGGVTTVADSGAGALTKAGVDAVVETTAEVVAACGATVVEGCGLEDIKKAATVVTVKTAPRAPIVFALGRRPGLRVCASDADLAVAGPDACSMMVLPKPDAWDNPYPAVLNVSWITVRVWQTDRCSNLARL
jgi:hypothetical protein